MEDGAVLKAMLILLTQEWLVAACRLGERWIGGRARSACRLPIVPVEVP